MEQGEIKKKEALKKKKGKGKKSSCKLQARQAGQGAAPQLLLHTHLFDYGV